MDKIGLKEGATFGQYLHRSIEAAQNDMQEQVYMLSFYFGSATQFMHTRHVGHAQEVGEESTPLGRHFALHGLNNMTVQMIDCIQEGREDAEEALRCLEGVWQHRLATFEVHGNINSRDELTMNRHQQNNHPLVRFAQGILDI